MEKNTRVKVLENPRNPQSVQIGVGKLVHCFSKKAHHDLPTETWSMEMEGTGEKETHIVHPRDILPVEK